ncbi:MAG: SxtJ family membrane protein [Planctomycetia bacterium]
MQLSDIPWHPSPRVLRQFAGLLVLFCGGLGCREALVRDRPIIGMALVLAAAVACILGFVAPMRLRTLFVGWMILVFPLGWLVSRITLAILFFGMFTPLGLIFRLLGRDPLGVRLRTNKKCATSHWETRSPHSHSRTYFRQF